MRKTEIIQAFWSKETITYTVVNWEIHNSSEITRWETQTEIQAIYTKYTEYWRQWERLPPSTDLLDKSTGYLRSTTESTRSAGSTTWSATRSTLTVSQQPPVANPVANTVDSISHAHFRSNFRTPEVETEIVEMKQMRQMQDRGTHNYRQQMRDPDLQTDLQSDLQEDLHPDLQVDLQKDLQANLQMDLQVNLQVRTG